MPTHLTPLSEPTRDALVTGDPRRAFALAQALTVQPKMSHQARGLWGYTGVTEAGLELTIQSTGSGGPGATAVIGDLAALGVKRLVRLGTCVAAPGTCGVGETLLVERAIAIDGTGQSPGTAEAESPDQHLLGLLEGVAPAAAVSSHGLVSRFDPAGPTPAEGAAARDLQTAAVLAFSRHLGIEAAAILVVSGIQNEEMLGEAELEPIFTELGLRVVRRLEKN